MDIVALASNPAGSARAVELRSPGGFRCLAVHAVLCYCRAALCIGIAASRLVILEVFLAILWCFTTHCGHRRGAVASSVKFECQILRSLVLFSGA